ncbi:ADP-ribosylation factor-binding protein GGA1 isoform X2 [Cephus cinctus]|uniref:ADP-ribosylation factor-binding protein GGA1 isoform X2 n=1 Tax=Cephus cinctus TaxID=211228 RepID=A0AAJ7FRB2_CEPCN|nr:ADP-ribosylation factor-binding protein GGA1 isoform X2 [Cephus cinctus]
MDVVTTSLEALIQRVTNPQNQKPDIAAIEAFCFMVTKESEGVHIGSKLLATHIQSPTEWEALQALTLLDTCMTRCGPAFHAEVGKFRFLNEMIKLVSPKYLGSRTPSAVRQKVLQLLYSWTREYPRETKIREAYDMLKKQGVVKEEVAPIPSVEDPVKTVKVKNPIFEDEEKSKLLQKLLQSKNPDDLQAANRLIKTMVKEDEKRVQQNSRRIMELESVHNNVRLLCEMLDSYNPGQASVDDLELMKELYQACERLRPNVLRLANETQDNEEMLNEVLAASDELGQVFDKYASVIVLGRPFESKQNLNNGPSLLDLSSPIEIESTDTGPSIPNKKSEPVPNPQSDLEVLGDIFNSIGNSSAKDSSLLLPETDIMQPISVASTAKKEGTEETSKIDSKAKALEDLNELGESLLKQSLSSTTIRGHFNNSSKTAVRVPMNSMKPLVIPEPVTQADSLFSNSKSSVCLPQPAKPVDIDSISTDLLNGDDSLVDISVQSTIDEGSVQVSKVKVEEGTVEKKPVVVEPEIKPLTDINVTLENIKPGTIPPLTVIEEKNGISVVLHFAKDGPRPDVSVIVVTTMSKNSKALTNYLFQAVVPKKCKCRLQPPSGTELPAHNPFLPPSAITQIMLIANPLKEPVSLKFMLSYTMDDETVTEMGEVDKLPSA